MHQIFRILRLPDSVHLRTDKLLPRSSSAAMLIVIVSLVLQSCAGRGAGDSDWAPRPVILVAGAVDQDGPANLSRQTLWTSEIEKSLCVNSRFDCIHFPLVKSEFKEHHSQLLHDYSEDALISNRMISRLVNTGLHAQYVVLLYLDSADDTSKWSVRRAARSASGEALRDRTTQTYYSSRDHAVTGSVFDLASGQRIWHRSFETKPVTSRTYTHYHGSSFAGDVAALFANRLVNGRKQGEFPDPPATGVAIRELSAELIFQMLNGPEPI